MPRHFLGGMPRSEGMTIATSRPKTILFCILAVALTARIVAAFWWQGRLPDDRSHAFGDTTSYWVLARHLVRGEPYRYGIDQSSVFRAPGCWVTANRR